MTSSKSGAEPLPPALPYLPLRASSPRSCSLSCTSLQRAPHMAAGHKLPLGSAQILLCLSALQDDTIAWKRALLKSSSVS